MNITDEPSRRAPNFDGLGEHSSGNQLVKLRAAKAGQILDLWQIDQTDLGMVL